MFTIYWYCFGKTASEKDEKFVAGALNLLAQRLKEEFKLPIIIKRLRDEPELKTKVAEKLEQLKKDSYKFSDCARDISNILPYGYTYSTKLLAYCSPCSHIAVAARNEKSVAKWGCTCARLAAIYSPNNKNTICHEALHLLGADDCYIEDEPYQKKPDCNFNGCIMEYVPAENVCENWPFLCDKNLLILDDLAKEIEKCTLP